MNSQETSGMEEIQLANAGKESYRRDKNISGVLVMSHMLASFPASPHLIRLTTLGGKNLYSKFIGQSPSAVISEPRKIKSTTVSTVSPSICHEVMGLDAMILVF